MPLGDSITVGKYSGHDPVAGVDVPGDDIGYRKDLWDLLQAAGYNVDFVGTKSNGSAYPFSDPEHEGHNGWRDDEIAANIYNNGGENWLVKNPGDVILLHIGTNSLNTDPSDVEDILDEIDQFESHTGSKVIVIVAKIIDQVPNNATVTNFNTAVAGMVGGRGDFESELFIVDMQGGAGLNYSIWPGDPTGDMIDSLHPYATGYAKMADVWFAKYDEKIGAASPNDAPQITNPGSQSSPQGVLVNLPITATDPDGEPITFTAYNLPPGLTINSSTGSISGTINGTAPGGSSYNATIIVADGNLCGTSSISFTWTVINGRPDIVSSVNNRTDNEGDFVQIDIDAIDPNNDNLTYSATNLPPGININSSNGLISGVIGYSASEQVQFSNFQVQVKVADDGTPSLEDTINFTWTVNDIATDAPVVNNPGDQRNKTGEHISLQIIASDLEGEDLDFVAENLPGNLVINLNTGEISGQIQEWAALASPYDVTVTVTDESANSTAIDFTWIVSKEDVFLPLVVKK